MDELLQNPNYREMIPMHDDILKLPDAYELSVHFWRVFNSFSLTPWRYELIKVREARDERIRQLIWDYPKEEHMRRHFGYCNKEERESWEMISGQQAILPTGTIEAPLPLQNELTT